MVTLESLAEQISAMQNYSQEASADGLQPHEYIQLAVMAISLVGGGFILFLKIKSILQNKDATLQEKMQAILGKQDHLIAKEKKHYKNIKNIQLQTAQIPNRRLTLVQPPVEQSEISLKVTDNGSVARTDPFTGEP